MVSQLSNRAIERPKRPTGTRLVRAPYVLFIVSTLLVGGLIWSVIFSGDDAATKAAECPLSEEAKASGISPQSATALDDIEPEPLASTSVRVLNANGQSGEASAVAAQLSERGFRSAGATATGNDPLYPGQNLECHGQIRYGESGAKTARALSLAAPCMELVSDPRTEPSVDLVLGTIFAKLSDAPANVAALDQLKAGNQPAVSDLSAARTVSC